VPDLNVWYGPDSYMGANIKELFQQMSKMTDEEIAEIHPGHCRDSIASLLPRLHHYEVNLFFGESRWNRVYLHLWHYNLDIVILCILTGY
jgi:hypothetical protein